RNVEARIGGNCNRLRLALAIRGNRDLVAARRNRRSTTREEAFLFLVRWRRIRTHRQPRSIVVAHIPDRAVVALVSGSVERTHQFAAVVGDRDSYRRLAQPALLRRGPNPIFQPIAHLNAVRWIRRRESSQREATLVPRVPTSSRSH